MPVPLIVAPVTRVPRRFSTGIGSPVIMDSSTALRAVEDDAVDRDLLARPHAQPVAGVHVLQRHILLAAVARERRAVFGARPSRARIAPPVRLRARSSSTWPSSTSVMITAAASK